MFFFFFFSSRRRHTRLQGDWSSDVCSSDLIKAESELAGVRLVLLSSLGGRVEAEELKVAGIDNCLVKPIKQSLLFDSIVTVMAHNAMASISKAEKILPPSSQPAVAIQKLRILLAEDNAVNQQVAIGLL